MSILHEDVGHQDTVACLSFSPDGSQILSGSWDGTAKLWNISTGRLVRTFAWGSAQINAVAWSADGAVVAVAGERPPVQLSEAQLEAYQAYFDHRDPSFFDTHDDSTESVEETPLFDARTGALLKIIPDAGHGVAFSPDGRTIAVASLTSVSIIDLCDGKCLARFCDDQADLRNVDYSSDGQRLACGDSDGVRVLDGRSAELVYFARDRHLFSEPESDLANVAVRELITVPENLEPEQEPAYALKFWRDTLPDFQLRNLSDGGMGLQRIAFARDGTRAVYAAYHALVALRADTHEVEWRSAPSIRGWLRTVAFSPDGELLAAAGDGGDIILWNMETGCEVSRIGEPPAEVTCVAFSSQQSYLAAGTKDGSVFLCDSREPNVVAASDFLGPAIKQLDFSPAANLLLVASSDGTVRILGLPELNTVLERHAHAARLVGCAFSADGMHFTTIGYASEPERPFTPEANAQIAIWSSSNGVMLNSQSFPDRLYLTSIQQSPDRSRIAITAREKLLIAEITENNVRIQPILQKYGGAFKPVALCDHERIVVADAGYGMKVFELVHGNALLSFSATRDGATALVVSHDGRMLARSTAYFHEIELFDLATGKLKAYCLGHQNAVGSLAISHDDRLLASGGRDGTLKLWNLPSGRLIASIVLSRASDSPAPEWKHTSWQVGPDPQQ